jgi:hypothetical protein
MKLRHRVHVSRAPIKWANALVTKRHYLHRPVHPLACPFAYRVTLDGQTCGVIVMATPHFVKKRGLFGYPGLPTKWQTLLVSRVWLDPAVQNRTITDRRGHTHTLTVASCALAAVLRRVQRDWLAHHPPRFPDQPYHIRLILAYADIEEGHEGTIYQASNFERWEITKNRRRQHRPRGAGIDSAKILYIYRLPRPRWVATHQLELAL